MGSKNCMNDACRTTTSSEWKKGWSLKSGGFATLCHNCGLAYENSVFCETFHFKESGWRECKLCGKIFHCGCIASRYLYEYMDFGGISCLSCAKHLEILESASSPPLVSQVAAVEMSPDQQFISFAARLESPVHSRGFEAEVTNAELLAAIEQLHQLLRSSNDASQVSSHVLSSLRKSVLQNINNLRKDLERQSSQGSELKSFTARAVADLSSQIALFEQRLDAKINTLGTQLGEIISFLQGLDDKKKKKLRKGWKEWQLQMKID